MAKRKVARKKKTAAELDREKRAKKGELTIKELQLKAYGLTPAVLKSLIASLEADFTILEACHAAGITEPSFYNWRKKSREFLVKMDIARGALGRAAKTNVAKAITKSGSVYDSWKWLEKRQKELYSDRTEVTDGDGNPVITAVNVNVINKHRTFEDLDSDRKPEETENQNP